MKAAVFLVHWLLTRSYNKVHASLVYFGNLKVRGVSLAPWENKVEMGLTGKAWIWISTLTDFGAVSFVPNSISR